VRALSLRKSRDLKTTSRTELLMAPITVRTLLEQLVGKTIVEVSPTDRHEMLKTNHLFVYLMTEDGYLFRAGPNSFPIFKPGEYQG
jgi:hypothetical protein